MEEQEQNSNPSVQTRAREQGDGAPVMTFSNLSAINGSDAERKVKASKPFSIKLEIDIVQILLTIAALASRTWRLGIPRSVVFDELHFAKFASLYLKGVFFFDIHPPLGKMLLAAAGKYASFEGDDLSYDKIGSEGMKGVIFHINLQTWRQGFLQRLYVFVVIPKPDHWPMIDFPPNVPVEILRGLPAVLGSLIVPLVYQICVEVGMSRYAAVIASCFILFDNALLVQSRFMLMEGMLIFFSMLSICAYLKFRNCTKDFGIWWWFWLSLCGMSMMCTLSVKYVGCFTMILLVCLISKDFWDMLDDDSKSDISIVQHFLARVLSMLVFPVAFYLGIFYIHLSVLYKAGPHDNVMTSAFQASLEGGLATLTKGQPIHVAYGSQITLRHTDNVASDQPCWLHSHPHMYPVKYPDKRGSSHQQQVTCYIFKDINNWWIIKHPDRDNLVVEDPPEPVKHGDIVQIVHGITSRALNTHDVAAPVTPSNQEVSCYINYNVSMPAQNLWRVEIVNRESDDEIWQTIKSQIRLIHVNTTTALKTTGRQLPDWGFNQLEVAADRHTNQKATVWNVEEHRFTKSSEKEAQTAELTNAEMIPLKPTYLSFFSKFSELQIKMLLSNQDAQLEHSYSSKPKEWPFMGRNVAYWMNHKDNAQIHLLGNVVGWFAASIGILLYIAMGVFYLMRRQRSVFDISEAAWSKFLLMAELFVGGYLLHYLPFYLEDRTLFLHHYLPSVPFKILALVALGEHVYSVIPRKSYIRSIIQYGAVILIAVMVQVFFKFTIFTYGHESLSSEELDRLTWISSWEFLKHS